MGVLSTWLDLEHPLIVLVSFELRFWPVGDLCAAACICWSFLSVFLILFLSLVLAIQVVISRGSFLFFLLIILVCFIVLLRFLLMFVSLLEFDFYV